MRLLFLMNNMGSPPGVLQEETEALGHRASVLAPYKGISFDPDLPGDVPVSPDGFDGLVVLGGIMSANDRDAYPFIDQTKKLMRAFEADRKPVLGICLGAQLLAAAHGKPVYQMDAIDWGFKRVRWLAPAEQDPLFHDADDDVHVMRWHIDTFDLPDHAVHLASHPDCPSQAFRLGDTTWAVQFHLELDRETLVRWAGLRADEMKVERAPFVADMQRKIDLYFDDQAAFARRVMRRWLTICDEARQKREGY